jgi:hypothetical protein
MTYVEEKEAQDAMVAVYKELTVALAKNRELQIDNLLLSEQNADLKRQILDLLHREATGRAW